MILNEMRFSGFRKQFGDITIIIISIDLFEYRQEKEG